MRRLGSRALLWAGVILLALAAGLLWRLFILRDSCRVVEGQEPPSSALIAQGRRLDPGKPVHCKFTADPTHPRHLFRLRLQAGQFLQLSFSQLEIDVSVELWSPDREALLRADSPPGADERLFLVAPETGVYKLIVSSKEPGTAGSYSVSIEILKPSSERDELRAQASSFSAAGEVCLNSGGHECARIQFEKALARWRALYDLQGVSETLYKLGVVKSVVGDHGEAYSFWRENVLPLWRNTRREPWLLNQMGEEALTGPKADPKTSLSFHQQALGLERARWHSEDFRALLGLINAYYYKGEIQQGLSTFRTALGLVRTERERAELFGIVGNLFFDMGDFERALQVYDRALEWLPEGAEERASVLSMKGYAQCRTGEYNSGLKTLDQALRLSINFPGSVVRTYASNNKGMCYVEMYEGKRSEPELLKKAKRLFDEARDRARRGGDRNSEAIATSYLGRILDLQGSRSEAIDFFSRAYDLADESFSIGRAGALHGRARAARGIGRPEEALSDIQKAIPILEGIRKEAGSSQLRATFLSNRRRFYELEIALLAELHKQDPEGGYAASAFERSEAFRSRSLLEELVSRRRPNWIDHEEDARQLDEIEAELQRLHPLLRLPLDEAISYKPEEIEDRVRDLFLQWEILRAKSGGTVAADLEEKALSIEHIREQLLDDDTLIVAYMLGEEESFVWVIGSQSIYLYTLGEGKDIEKQARIAADLLAESHAEEDREKLDLVMADLSDKLLAPIAEHLGRHRLLILRDGGLYRLPFEALIDPRRPGAALMDSNEVVYEPSAAVFAAILERGRQRPPAEKKLAAFGDAVFQAEALQSNGGSKETRQSGDLSQLERLKDSGEEVKKITRLLPEGEALSLLRFDARRDLFLELEQERYETIHIATHSRLDEVFPELSSLVFSMVDEKGKPQNGLLTFYEISDLNLPVDMVVLSACRSALGKEIKGEGVIGLGRAFLHAGASRVVVSLWDVDDKVTAVLMERFYKGMYEGKLSPSQALRQARIFVRSQPEWQAPYYWAPFVLEGDWH